MKKHLTTLLFISCSSVQAITDCATQTDILESECNTLLSFFNSTGGGGWYDVFANGWAITQTPCAWTGMTCNDNHVTEIDRANKGLNGTLSDLNNLPYLEILNVSDNNQLTGTIDYQQLPPSLKILNYENTELIEPVIIEPVIKEFPLLGQGQKINILTGEQFDSNSQFRGGISTGGQNDFEQNVSLLDGQFVSIKGHIQIAEQHVGQRADLLALGIYDVVDKTLYYTNTPEGVKIIEIGRFGIPIFNDDKLLKKDILLEESMEFILYEGQLFVGQLNVYFGYRVESQPDSIFYTMNPIRAVVQ